MTAVHVSAEVKQVQELHPYLTNPRFRALSIREQVLIQAETLQAAFEARDRRVAMHVFSWWPGARGATEETLFAHKFTLSDAVETMCREYGFVDVNHLNSLGDLTLDATFESALDHVLAGDTEELASRLDFTPELVAARSRFGHRSTLLHYLGANGVESHRQIVPVNAAQVAELLISKGASKTVEADMYGGGQTPYMLAATSAHPRRAGISEELNRALRPS